MTDKTRTYAEGIEFTAEVPDEFAEILTPDAVAFVAKLSMLSVLPPLRS